LDIDLGSTGGADWHRDGFPVNLDANEIMRRSLGFDLRCDQQLLGNLFGWGRCNRDDATADLAAALVSQSKGNLLARMNQFDLLLSQQNDCFPLDGITNQTKRGSGF
jgi:hypothetical protein